MTDLRSEVTSLVKRSLQDPRGAARQIIDMNLSLPVLLNGVVLVVILSVLMTYGTVIMAGPDAIILQLTDSPMVFALFMVVQMVFLVVALLWTGKVIGGVGTIEAFAALLTWLQMLWLMVQVVQTVLMLLLPSAAAMLGIASLVFGLWILIQFIAEAHGFPNWIKAVGVLAMAFFGVIAGLSFLLSIIGISTLGLTSNV